VGTRVCYNGLTLGSKGVSSAYLITENTWYLDECEVMLL